MWNSLSAFITDRAAITAVGAFVLWVLSRLVEMGLAWRTRREKRESLIRSLFAEVDFNTRDLHFFAENSASMPNISARLRQSDSYLPHVTDAHHTIIYTTRVNDLYQLDDSLVARLVLFYGLLAKIKAQIDGINQKSFSQVSAEGKITVLQRILTNSEECCKEGEQILRIFSEKYPHYRLARHTRRMVVVKQPEPAKTGA